MNATLKKVIRGVPLLLAVGCAADEVTRDPEVICGSFEGAVLSGYCDEESDSYGPALWHISRTVSDFDASYQGDPADAIYVVRDADVTLRVEGGIDVVSPAGELAVCVGPDCTANYPANFVRSLDTSTGGNGVLQFVVAVGYGIAGTVFLEFDRFTCMIGVKVAYLGETVDANGDLQVSCAD